MATFEVLNNDHAGTTLATFTPVGGSLRWSYRLAQQGGPGDIQWEVPLSDSSLTADVFGPYRTDWVLRMNGIVDLCGGITTTVNTGSESDGLFSSVKVAGLDWLHYLEQPYPFSFSSVASNQATNQLSTLAQLFKIWNAQTMETIVTDLISSVSAYESVPSFTEIFSGTGWSNTLDKEIGFGDDTTILQLILDIAGLGSGASALGFDVWVDPNKVITLTSPRITSPSAVTPSYTLNDATIVVPPLDWTNNGPRATDTVTFGSAANNTNRIGFSTYQSSRDTYRRWVRFEQLNMASSDTIAAAADSIGYQDRFPHKDLKLTIRPDLLDAGDETAGFLNHLGEAIAVNYNISPYHHINANFWIVEQQFYSPDGCNWLCDLTLEQIYSTTGTPD